MNTAWKTYPIGHMLSWRPGWISEACYRFPSSPPPAGSRRRRDFLCISPGAHVDMLQLTSHQRHQVGRHRVLHGEVEDPVRLGVGAPGRTHKHHHTLGNLRTHGRVTSLSPDDPCWAGRCRVLEGAGNSRERWQSRCSSRLECRSRGRRTCWRPSGPG